MSRRSPPTPDPASAARSTPPPGTSQALAALAAGALSVGVLLVPAVMAAAVLVTGCGLSAPFDAGADAGAADAPSIARRTLVSDGAPTVTLAPLAEATFRVRLLDEATRSPVAGARVTFAIEGAPRSSTLRQLAAETDVSGAASVVLIAGPLPTTFRVRASAEGAAPLSLEVSVGIAFGELQVEVQRATTRALGSYVLRVAADLPCSEILTADAGDERMLGLELPSTSFPALATGAAWTVDVRGLNVAGLVVARGCVEGVRVETSAPTQLVVEVRDVPLSVEGAYDATLSFAASEAAREVHGALDAALSSSPMADAPALLDGLALELAERGSGELAVLAAARLGGLDARLATELEGAGAGLVGELDVLGDEIDAMFGAIVLEGALVQRDPIRLGVSRALVTSIPVEGPFAATLGDIVPTSGRDEQTVRGVEITLGIGTLWVGALRAQAATRGADGLAGVLAQGATCSALHALVSREATLSSCDEACVRAGCARAASELDGLLDAAALAADARASALRFDAVLELVDEDGDLRPDEMRGSGIEGRWEPVAGGTGFLVNLGWTGRRDDALE